jgi:hypothetical protein
MTIAKSLENISKSVEEINTTLIKMNTTLSKQTLTLREHQNYIDKDAKSIENEINKRVEQLLETKFKGFRIIHILKEMAFFDKIYPYNSMAEITQFDGVYIITNDDNYEPSTDVAIDFIYNKPSNSKIYLVIVEAKHDITSSRFNDKLRQIVKIQETFEIARKITKGTFSEMDKVEKQFKWRNRVLQFYNFEFEIYLFIGGPYLEKNAEDFIKEHGNTLWKHPNKFKLSDNNYIDQKYPIRTFLILPQGKRYATADVADNYKIYDPHTIGGKVRKTKKFNK